MNGLKRVASTLVVVTGISIGAWTAPAIAAVTSAGHLGSPEVFHCC